MNHEEIIAKMKALTEQIRSKEGELTEEDLGDFMSDVSQSLNQVFAIAQGEITKGLQQIEKAQQTLIDQDMAQEAEAITPIIENMVTVQNQINVGLEVSQQRRDFVGYDTTPHPERVLTREILERLQGLEKAIQHHHR